MARPTSRATPRSTSAPSRAASHRATRLSYVPAAAIVVRTERAARDRRLRPPAALRRGRRRRVAPRRGRLALPLRTGRASCTTDRGARGAALVAQRVGYGSSAAPLARRHPGALAPGRASAAGAAGRGPCWPPANRSRPLAVAGGTTPALVRKLPGVPATESLRLAGLGPPPRRPPARRRRPAGVVAAAAGRRARVASGCARVAVAAARAGAARRAASPSSSTTSPTASGCGRASSPSARPGPLRPRLHVVARSLRPRPEPATSPACTRRRGVTLRLTVDTDDWRAHVDHVARQLPGSRARRQGQRLRVRPSAAGAPIAAELADTHRRRHGARARPHPGRCHRRSC